MQINKRNSACTEACIFIPCTLDHFQFKFKAGVIYFKFVPENNIGPFVVWVLVGGSRNHRLPLKQKYNKKKVFT